MEGQHQFPHCYGILGSPVAESIQFQLFQKFPLLLSQQQGWMPVLHPQAASISGESSASRTSDAETIWATFMPFFRKTRDSDMFLIITDTLLLLILSLVYVCRTWNPGSSSHAPWVEQPQPSKVSPSPGHSPQ